MQYLFVASYARTGYSVAFARSLVYQSDRLVAIETRYLFSAIGPSNTFLFLLFGPVDDRGEGGLLGRFRFRRKLFRKLIRRLYGEGK
jgi:hypothetical protein